MKKIIQNRTLKIAVYTLGCKVNQYESDSLMDLVKKAGHEVVSFDQYADVYVINTCSVTNMAERKSRQIIHRAKKNNSEAIVVAMGCYVQADKENVLKDESVDIVIGNNRKNDFLRILKEYINDNEITDNYIDINQNCEYENMNLIMPAEHCRAYVKVQDGCNNFCTYCIIPYTRGRIRSRELSEVITEVEGLVSRGIKEVVITGINLSSYCDSEDNKLLELLLKVSEIEGLERVRMGSLEPRIITDQFLENICKIDKICPHFHLSLQSACNETLKRMNRKYTIEEYEEKCNLIRKYYDRPAITTDIIVGFPGETDEEFDITYNNLKRINLYEMHVFKYSKRNGTIAATMPNQVSDAKKDERSNLLLELTSKQKKMYEDSFEGEELNVLVEEIQMVDGREFYKGHTDRYILMYTEIDGYTENCINTIVKIKMQKS